LNNIIWIFYYITYFINLYNPYYFTDIIFNPRFFNGISSSYLTYPIAQGTETISTLKTSNINIINESEEVKNLIPFPGADRLILQSLKNISLFGKSVAVIGSKINPWLEAILLNNGARDITVVDYDVPQIENNSNIRSMHFNDFANSSTQYDYIFSYSFISGIILFCV
jgi:hypothetical protein